jgi:heme-degrading monooxygenase HmoA
MVVVLFRSLLTAEAGADYGVMADEMLARARTMAGFIDFKSFTAADGEHVAIIHWESQDTLRAWSDDLRHVVAQRLGRDKWYEYFQVEVADIARSYRFDRPK